MLSRIWYIVLAAAVGAGFAAAYLVNAASLRHEADQVAEKLGRDRTALELWLRLDARSRLDAIAPLAAHKEVRGALRAATGHSGTVDGTTKRRLRIKLRELNAQLEEGRGDILLVIDGEGEVVAELGAGLDGKNHRLDAMPLIADALRGYVRDDIWLYNGRVYRMGARPAIDGGQYVGVLAHGIAVDKELAKRLSKRLPGATVGFFIGPRLITVEGESLEEIGRANLDSMLKETLAAGLLDSTKATAPQAMGDKAEALFSLVTGTAAHAQVGYLIGRSKGDMGAGLVGRVSKDDVQHIPWLLVIGLPILLALFGIALIHLERDKPLSKLVELSTLLSKGNIRGLPASDFRNKYRELSEHVNTALERGVGVFSETPPPRAIPLDEVLGKVQQSKGQSEQYVGFVTELPPGPLLEQLEELEELGEPIEDHSEPSMPHAPEPSQPTVPRAREASQPTMPKGPPPPPPGATPGPTAKWKTAPAPENTPAPSEANTPTPTPTPREELLAAYPEFDGDDDATIVAEPPEELLEASDGEPLREAALSDDDRHFREVFEQYVATQKECGESIDGLTFDKFARKLQTTRDNVMDRHGASTVRFTVYVKDGRAAIKASPLRD